jgi:hypothetical protein
MMMINSNKNVVAFTTNSDVKSYRRLRGAEFQPSKISSLDEAEGWSISHSDHFTPKEDSQLYTSDSVGPRKKNSMPPFHIKNPSTQGHSQLLPAHSNNKNSSLCAV